MIGYSDLHLLNAQEGSRRTRAAKNGEYRDSRARSASVTAARLAECGAELERVVVALYGPGKAIPAAEGGFLFHEVCKALQGRGYDVTERQLAEYAEAKRLWTSTVRDVVCACRPGAERELPPEVPADLRASAPGPVPKVDESMVPRPAPQACCRPGLGLRRGLCGRCYSRWRNELRKMQRRLERGEQ